MLLAWQITGVLLGLAGIAALHLAWQRKEKIAALPVVGWTLVAASILAWSRTSGIDKGPALGILAIVLIALAVLAMSAWRTPPRARRAQRERVAHNGERGGSLTAHAAGTRALMLAVIVLLGFAAALAACSALFLAGHSVGFEHTGNLAVAMFAFPMVWAGLATWLGYHANPVRGAAILAALLAAAVVLGGLAAWGA